MPRRLKSESAVTSERIVSERRYRFNPIRNLNSATLVQRIEAWDAGHLNELARTFHAIESRDDQLATIAPARYDGPSRLPWDILVAEGESENPEALKQRAELLYFYNNLRATDVTEQNLRGSLSLFLRQAARARGHRYSVHETVWQPRAPVWATDPNGAPVVRDGLSAEYRFVPLWFFENTESRLRYLPINAGTYGVEMTAEDWFVCVGTGLLLPSTINYVFQRMSLNDWLQFNKDFGAGFLDAETSAEKSSAEWTGLRNDIAALFRAKGLVHGTGTKITYSGPQSGQAIFDALLERLEKRLIRLWTGSELAVKAGPSDSVGAGNQMQFTDAILEADALWLEEQVHEGVTMPVLRWWHGAGVRPLVYFKLKTPAKQNTDIELKKDTALIGWGAQIALGKLAEKYGATVANGEEFARPAAPTGSTVAASPPQGFVNEAGAARIAAQTKQAVARALAAANQPLAERLDVLLALDDEAAFIRELQAIAADPTLAAAVINSPAVQELAQAEANGMAAHLLNALTSRTAKPLANEKPTGFDTTDAMKAAAKRALDWRRQFNRGGTEIGVARARDILNGRIGADTIGRMVSFFARHEVDKQATGFNQGEEGFPSAGRIAWDLWGGDAGKAWAAARLRELEGEE
jgi:hypothetical protein